MATPKITVTLAESVSTDSLTLRAPAPDIQFASKRTGVTHRTAGGGVAQYKTGATWYEATLEIPSLTNAQKESLNTFFQSHWGKTTVTYTDENLNAFSGVRFLDDELAFRKLARDLWTVAIRLKLPATLK